MPNKHVAISNITLRPDFTDRFEEVMTSFRPVLAWRPWRFTALDGVEREVPLSVLETAAPPSALLAGVVSAYFTVDGRSRDDYRNAGISVRISLSSGAGTLTVSAEEEEIQNLAQAVETLLADYVEAPLERPAPPFKVFIAYGGGPAWEVVRDYLRRAGIEVDAFTEEERVGEVTIDVVSHMIRTSAMAVIVMTAMEQLRDETWHARQNVVHEAGFSQGVIGVRNTIILLEDGVVLPSNLANVTYIPFPRGAIHTTEARVVARVRETKADWESGAHSS